MNGTTGKRVVHSYDVATRRILCGVAGADRSTKHASGVTCAICRELLPGAPRVVAGLVGAADATHGA